MHVNTECRICLKKFKSKDVLRQHIKLHDPSHIQSVPCEYEGCQKTFSSVHL